MKFEKSKSSGKALRGFDIWLLAITIISTNRSSDNRKMSGKGVTMYARYAELRDQKGMTDYEVSKKAEVQQSLFSDWKKRSETDPLASLSIKNLQKVAKVLEVSLDDLMKETG